jgi:hypothetical protein
MTTTPDTSEQRIDSMQSNSLTFRVLASSTFSNLKAELDALQRDMFLWLREYCQKHDVRFQTMNLRFRLRPKCAAHRDEVRQEGCRPTLLLGVRTALLQRHNRSANAVRSLRS